MSTTPAMVSGLAASSRSPNHGLMAILPTVHKRTDPRIGRKEDVLTRRNSSSRLHPSFRPCSRPLRLHGDSPWTSRRIPSSPGIWRRTIRRGGAAPHRVFVDPFELAVLPVAGAAHGRVAGRGGALLNRC
jgi:hypothetical protein